MTRSSGESEQLWYGPMGELIMRRQGQQATWYAGAFATVTGSFDAQGNVIPASLAVDAHVLLGTTRVASVKSGASGRTLYYYRDRQGSVVATSLPGGAIGVRLRYGPYGRLEKVVDGAGSPVDCATSIACPELGYTGALRLSGSLLYLNARVYDTELRRFLSADSVDLQRYAYTGGDPVNFTDPSGLFYKSNPEATPSLRSSYALGQSGLDTLVNIDGWYVSPGMADFFMEEMGYCTGGASCTIMLGASIFDAQTSYSVAKEQGRLTQRRLEAEAYRRHLDGLGPRREVPQFTFGPPPVLLAEAPLACESPPACYQGTPDYGFIDNARQPWTYDYLALTLNWTVPLKQTLGLVAVGVQLSVDLDTGRVYVAPGLSIGLSFTQPFGVSLALGHIDSPSVATANFLEGNSLAAAAGPFYFGAAYAPSIGASSTEQGIATDRIGVSWRYGFPLPVRLYQNTCP